MMYRVSLILSIGVLLLVTGCGSSVPDEPSWTAEDLPATMQSHYDGELRIQREEILPATNVFDAQDEFRIVLSEDDSMEAYRFEEVAQARAVMGFVSSDGQHLSNAPALAQALHIPGPWHEAMSLSGNPIPYFRCHNFIVSYSGGDSAVIDMLTAICGERFVGN